LRDEAPDDQRKEVIVMVTLAVMSPNQHHLRLLVAGLPPDR